MIFHRSKHKWITITLIILSGLFAFQFYWLIVTSLQMNTQLLRWPPAIIPKKPTLFNFRALNFVTLGKWLKNSLIVSSCAAALSTMIVTVGGYALARARLWGCKVILAILLLASAIPAQIILVPKFILVANILHLYDTLIGMILPALFTPLAIFLVHQFCLGLPQEIMDAARIDGAGEWALFWRILLPMMKPILATVFLFRFTSTWGDFLWQSVMIQSTSITTAPVGLVLLGFGASAQGLPEVAAESAFLLSRGIQPAAGLILGIPTCLLFFLLQKYFIKGGFIQRR